MGPKKRSLTQPSPNRQKIGRISSTQPSIHESFASSTNNTNELNDEANEVIRLIIYQMGKKLPIRKNDLQKHIQRTVGKSFDRVLEIVSNTLEKVYGYKMILSDSGNKYYFLSNNLPYVEEDPENQEMSELPEDRQKILLLLILTHIYMSSNVVSQASLYSFLRSLHIDPERRHEIFGDVKEYITVNLVKQHYLTIEKDPTSQEISYSWGDRAEKEISKMEILDLVCKVIKGINPKSWSTLYETAMNQPLENHRNEVETVNNEE
ncbi:non-structural maintenance of chromosomes element 3 homolog [Harmonia axyridis]|uniref:non-structural maintenance of chromosomes element 3 homolog n=1 Tax=Harmonia axyridis TaxID=115357 RepID=UPI001E2767CE|nr:non-structural maintenance of chromosomes element 3 homolog [Harmonia axyridis]